MKEQEIKSERENEREKDTDTEKDKGHTFKSVLRAIKQRNTERDRQTRQTARQRNRQTDKGRTFRSVLSSLKNQSQLDNINSMIRHCWAMSVIMDILLSSDVQTRQR